MWSSLVDLLRSTEIAILRSQYFEAGPRPQQKRPPPLTAGFCDGFLTAFLDLQSRNTAAELGVAE